MTDQVCEACLGGLGFWRIVGTRGYFEECKKCGGTGKVNVKDVTC